MKKKHFKKFAALSLKVQKSLLDYIGAHCDDHSGKDHWDIDTPTGVILDRSFCTKIVGPCDSFGHPKDSDYEELEEKETDAFTAFQDGLLKLVEDAFEEFLSKEATKWYARRPDYMTEEDARKALCGKGES